MQRLFSQRALLKREQEQLRDLEQGIWFSFQISNRRNSGQQRCHVKGKATIRKYHRSLYYQVWSTWRGLLKWTIKIGSVSLSHQPYGTIGLNIGVADQDQHLRPINLDIWWLWMVLQSSLGSVRSTIRRRQRCRIDRPRAGVFVHCDVLPQRRIWSGWLEFKKKKGAGVVCKSEQATRKWEQERQFG